MKKYLFSLEQSKTTSDKIKEQLTRYTLWEFPTEEGSIFLFNAKGVPSKSDWIQEEKPIKRYGCR